MHPSDGEIRSTIDQETPDTRREIANHLETCARCQKRRLEFSRKKQLAETAIGSISFNPQPNQHAAMQLKQRLEEDKKERKPMIEKIYNRVPRFAWASLAVIAILTVALMFPPVRAIANSFLGLFRVERVQVVPVDMESLSQRFGSASSFEKFLSEEVQVEEAGDFKVVTSTEEASAAAGIAVRLPGAIEGTPKLGVQPGGRMTFRIDTALARAVLDDMGRQDIVLPEGLDASPIVVEVKPAVTAMYGDCPTEEVDHNPDGDIPDQPPSDNPPDCTTLLQTLSPTISAPPGLNLGAIGEAYLQILGMSPEEAASFAANVDWTTTFVVPIPMYANYQAVTVDGVSGTLVQHHELGSAGYVLLWVKDGLLYVLSGPGNVDKALGIANSLN